MNEKIVVRPPQIGPIAPAPSKPVAKTGVETGTRFETIFQEQLAEQTGIKFSAHALKRLESRQLSLGSQEMVLLKDAVNKAEAKGAKESLILMDQMALVVSIKNRTVITAVDESSLKDNVFTNIDSAVIVKQ
ncbi:MAG: TIGR02530 family flagellar biosynthesis protein [Bacteroidota bacterium]